MERRNNEAGALTIFLMGTGVFLLVLGPCTGLYGIGLGFVGLVASWVVAITLRVLHGGPRDDNDYWAYR
jgi:dolichol kinase